MTYEQSSITTEVTWNAETGRFSFANLYWLFDADGSLVEHGQSGDRWRHLFSYDDQRTLLEFRYIWDGAVSSENSWDQDNTYAGGVLVTSALTFLSGTQQLNRSYEYAGALVSAVTEVHDYQGQIYERQRVYTRENGKIIEVEYESGGIVYSRETAYYDDEQRLVRVDTDGVGLGPIVDGTPDLRLSWAYDESGRIVRHELDGNNLAEGSYIDGEPDLVEFYEPSCADIALVPTQLYHVPRWMVAQAGSATDF